MGSIKNFFKNVFRTDDEESYTPSPIANPTRDGGYTKFADLLPYLAWIP